MHTETKLLKGRLKQVEGVTDFYELQHAWRLNGLVDVWKNGKTVFDMTSNLYQNFDDWDQAKGFIEHILQNNEPRQRFKKTAKGNMTYKEFKNNQYNK